VPNDDGREAPRRRDRNVGWARPARGARIIVLGRRQQSRPHDDRAALVDVAFDPRHAGGVGAPRVHAVPTLAFRDGPRIETPHERTGRTIDHDLTVSGNAVRRHVEAQPHVAGGARVSGRPNHRHTGEGDGNSELGDHALRMYPSPNKVEEPRSRAMLKRGVRARP
jgi:hypothetical protein